MEIPELLSDIRDTISVKRVYGDPYEKDGLTVIPAAVVRGGAGGGVGERDGKESGRGGGFGVNARPSGAWIIEGRNVTWKPAVDVNRIVLGGQLIALAAVLVAGRVLAAHGAAHGLAAPAAPRRRRRAPHRHRGRLSRAGCSFS